MSQSTTPAPPVVDTGSDLVHAKRLRRLMLLFLVLGLLARSVRYFLCFPLWDDECFLCFNFIDRGYAELLQPLHFYQVAPWLFLWIEATMVKLLGFSELSLRLFPFLCSIASLFLFRHLAQRLLRGSALIIAFAIFAVAYPCIRYSAEAKQYSSDLFASLVLVTLLVEWWQRPERTRILWWLVALTPLMICLSYPTLFTAGGISLALGWHLWKTRQSGRLAWVMLNLAVLLSVGFVYVLCARHQSNASLKAMRHYWQASFPPLSDLGKLPGWTLRAHTGALFAYPIGANNGASALTFVCLLIAIVSLIRRREQRLLLLCLVPLALHFFAACLQRYPYGQHPKFSHYTAPILCLLMGLGIAQTLDWWRSRPNFARRSLAGWLVVFGLIGLGSIARDIVRPYKTKADLRLRAFSRWFWPNLAHESQVADLHRDLGLTFSPRSYHELTYVAMYHCNQQIYSPRHRRNEKLAKLQTDRPLTCLRFCEPRLPDDRRALQRWLTEMQKDYHLSYVERFPFPRYDKQETRLINLSYVELYRFVPRSTAKEDHVAATRRDPQKAK